MSDATSPWAKAAVASSGVPGSAGPAAAAPAAPDLTPSRPIYDGKLSELYAIYLRHVVLMLLTLGWSRFWGRTRLRRYLWSHVSVLGDRFEYRGRGRELLIGFLLAVVMLAVWGGLMYVVWVEVFHERPFSSFGVFDAFSLSVVLLGIPLAFVGHYAGLRYKLSRTRWRGIRCGLAGSAWRYGASATGLTFVNVMTAQLLTPVVSVKLARPRIVNLRYGTLPLEFAGRASDIYGRYLGYYFLNIVAWVVAAIVLIGAIGGTVGGLDLSEEEFLTLFSQPNLRTVLLALAAAIGAYMVFGLLVLPLRCWWQAYLFRYLVSRSRAGNVLFATAITTRQMWGFMVLNYGIVVLTLGLGWPWVMHRTMKLISSELWLYGAPDGASIHQSADRGPRFGEGLLDMFDVGGV
ncbi:MAG: DUF898 domain-containing protein [Alphaproteobacteria bacterium]|nr:DUF898 domain-containing protein [Alphaproteobacteria bacterium]